MDIRKDRTLKAGSVSELKIKFVKPDFKNDLNLDSYGLYEHKTETISVQSDITDEQTCSTTLHEILHFLVRQAHLNQEGNCLSKDTDEERVVGQMETGLYGFFLNNPKEIAYIFHDILKQNPSVRKLIASIK